RSVGLLRWCIRARVPSVGRVLEVLVLSSWFLSVLQQGPHGGVSVWLALVVVPVAVAEDDGLHALVPVVFFDADSDSEVVACVEPRVWANEDSVTGGVGNFSESGWQVAAVIEVAHFWSPSASWIVVYMSQGQSI